MEKVKVVLTRSLISAKPNQKATAASLGLRRLGDSVIHDNDKVLAGKINVLSHLVKIEAL